MKLEDFSSVVLAAYDSTIETDNWRGAMDNLRHRLQCNSAILLVVDEASASFQLSATDTAFHQKALEFWPYYSENLVHHETPDYEALARLKPGQLVYDTEIGVPEEEVNARPDRVFLNKVHGMRRKMGGPLNDNAGWFDLFTVSFRSDMTGRERENIRRSLAPLVPHLARATELSRTFSFLKDKYLAAMSALDEFMLGVAIAAPNSHLLVANKIAHEIFDDRDGLKLVGSLLMISDYEQSHRFRRAVRRAADTARGLGDQPFHEMQITRRSDRSSYMLDIAPLGESHGVFGSGLRGAIIFIVDPERVPDFDMRRFAAVYGLTTAESEVCGFLVKGVAPVQIAERRGTAPDTARNQIKSIYAKTQCKGLTNLIRLMTKTVPPIRGPASPPPSRG